MTQKKKYVAPTIWIEETDTDELLLTAVSVVSVDNGAEGSGLSTPEISLNGEESSNENDFAKKGNHFEWTIFD